AVQGIRTGAVKDGDVVVLRYLGPRGAPGMPEMLGITSRLKTFRITAALITDGRFSGGTSGPCVGRRGPEAFSGGPIAAVADGDRIVIDVPGRRLHLDVGSEEVERRLAAVEPVHNDVPAGFLRRYRNAVSSAARGAIL